MNIGKTWSKFDSNLQCKRAADRTYGCYRVYPMAGARAASYTFVCCKMHGKKGQS